MRVQVEALDQLRATVLVDAAAHAGQQVDGLAAGQRRPQRDIAGHISDLAVQRDGVGPRVAAEQPHAAAVGLDQTQQDPDGGRLAGAVGPEEAVHFALAHAQVEAVERPNRAEVLCQIADFDGREHCQLTWDSP